MECWSKFIVQTVQAVQIAQTPSFLLPRVAGEDRDGGLNVAERLNGVQRLNGLNDFMNHGDEELRVSRTDHSCGSLRAA
jgi:hypothetical protein